MSTNVTLLEKTAAPVLLLSSIAATDDRFVFARHNEQGRQRLMSVFVCLCSCSVGLLLAANHQPWRSISSLGPLPHCLLLSPGCCHNMTKC